ncbi:MAG: DUF5011 domain-containing protein [Bacteroidetes bacterium]|nr:DUF5011 domain-containing protein [Bacteroidota bacterium]
MKYKIILFLLVIASFLSCNKVNIRQDDQYVGVSKITYYVVLTLKGDPIMSIVKGDTFTDPGATAKANGTDVPYTADGTVDTNTPGLYVITYSAVNADGYPSSISRQVVVLSAHENPGVDISGSYDYVGSSTFTSTITKVAEGVYTTDNLWSGLTTIPATIVTLNGTDIIIPNQLSGFGEMFGTGVLNGSGKLVYTVSIPSAGLNNVPRTWQKQ